MNLNKNYMNNNDKEWVDACKRNGIKPDMQYINRSNKKFGYAFLPDSKVHAQLNEIRQFLKNPKNKDSERYSFSHCKKLRDMLFDDECAESTKEIFIVVLREVDKMNLTKYAEKADELLAEYHREDYVPLMRRNLEKWF